MTQQSMVPFDEVFYRRGWVRANWGYAVLEVARKAAYKHTSQFVGSMMWDATEEQHFLLDGWCETRKGSGGGAKGVHIEGDDAARFVCYELGITQPPLARAENRVRSQDELLEMLAEQRRQFAEGTLKRNKLHHTELGLHGSFTTVGRG